MLISAWQVTREAGKGILTFLNIAEEVIPNATVLLFSRCNGVGLKLSLQTEGERAFWVFSCTTYHRALACLPRTVSLTEYLKLCQEGNLEGGFLSTSAGRVKTAQSCPCALQLQWH